MDSSFPTLSYRERKKFWAGKKLCTFFVACSQGPCLKASNPVLVHRSTLQSLDKSLDNHTTECDGKKYSIFLFCSYHDNCCDTPAYSECFHCVG